MKHTTTLVLTEPLPVPGMRILQGRADVLVRVLPAPTEPELARALPDADGVVMVMEQPALTATLVALAPRLRVACRFGAGYDNLDLAALSARAIPLATTGAANADTVAEHALYLMLALAKRGPALDRAVKGGGWPRGFGNLELRDRTCLVVGYGRIGRAIARRSAAFDMRVVVYDPHLPPEAPARDGYRSAENLADALPEADFVVLACALTAETRGHFGAAALARMKRSAFLVNVARGPVVVEAELLTALREGRLAGAGLDVLEIEPPQRAHPLLARDDVVVTPHVAAFVDTAYDRMAVACAQAALAGLDGALDSSLVVNAEVLRS